MGHWLKLLACLFILALVTAAPARTEASEPPARRAAALEDYRRSCAPQISAHGSDNASGFDYFRGPTVAEVQRKLQTVSRNNVSGTTFGALERCAAEAGLRHLLNGVPGFDHGVGRGASAAPAARSTMRPSATAKPAPKAVTPAKKLPPALPAKIARWSTKAMSTDPKYPLIELFAGARADALASCSAPIQQYAAQKGTTTAHENLMFEQHWLNDSEDMSLNADGVRNYIAVVDKRIAAGDLKPGVLAAQRAGRCLYQRRLAQLEGSPLVPGAVDGTLNPLSIGGQAPQWKQQVKDARIIAADGKSAMDCVKLFTLTSTDSNTSGGGRVLANQCSGPVEIVWCINPGECDRERGNMWTVQPGRSWPVSATGEIRLAACHGANAAAHVKGTFGLRYYCSAPAKN